MSRDDEQALIEWAHEYDGYERIAGGPEDLATILRPVTEEYERTRTIPEWVGVDLLRGWAFYVVRAHRFRGSGGPITEEFPEFVAIIEAVNRHSATAAHERPSARP